MALKLLMISKSGDEFKITQSKINGKVFKKYVEDGFKPIAWIGGFDIFISPLQKDSSVINMYNQINK